MPGIIAFAQGRYDEAIGELKRSDVERYLETTSMSRTFTDPGNLAAILERLGEMYDDRGDWEKAAEYYARFVDLWNEADPELQPRVENAQQRLDEIFAERG